MTTHHSRHSVLRRTAQAVAAGLLLPVLITGCTRTSSGLNSGDLYIEACSLACTDGQGGEQVFCAIVNVFENTEIAVRFSEPLDAASVGPATFRVVDVTNGTTPDGTYFVDPGDPRVAIFRPAIVFSNGGVGFAFRSNTSYEVTIPGQAQGDSAPFIRSIAGNPNQSRMQCTMFTSEGVTDPVPGNPEVQVFARQVVTDAMGVPILDPMGNPVLTPDLVFVDPQDPPMIASDSPIEMRFNELMNVATLSSFNPATGTFQPAFMEIALDLDGNLATSDPGDRIPQPGDWPFVVDETTLTTTVTFTLPTGVEFPSSGSDPAMMGAPNPRLVVLRIPQQVVDLTNLPVLPSTGGGTIAMIPEFVPFDPLTITEDFETNDREDVTHGGSVWAFAGSGAPTSVLAPGISGGSGRLGELIVQSNETLVLDTDSQVFPIGTGSPVADQVDFIGNQVMGDYPFGTTITDGVFEFSALRVEGDGRLILVGSNPARLLVRGPIEIAAGGVVDLSGGGGLEKDSLVGFGDDPASTLDDDAIVGGPGGGSGGFGADRADFAGTQLDPALAPTSVQTPGLVAPNAGGVRAGRGGAGVGGGGIGGGGGGPAWPNTYPVLSSLRMNGSDGDVSFNAVFSPDTGASADCVSLQMGAPGGGGGYSRAGGQPAAVPSPAEPIAAVTVTGGSNSLVPPVLGAPGDPSGLGLAAPNVNNTGYTVRLLEWENGNLRGGAGGGGGGNHPYGAHSNGTGISLECFDILGGLVQADWDFWHDHSGAPGGGGGGAVEFLSGKRIQLDGLIDATGGQGGSSKSMAAVNDFGQYAMGAGGGSGGAVRLRAPQVALRAGGTRIDISGGAGGTSFWSTITPDRAESMGGDGGTGLVRIEDGQSTGGVTFAGLRELVAPFDAAFPDDSLDFLSVASNTFNAAPVLRPESVTASSSCWIQPAGNFVALNFRADAGTALADMGWTMDVLVNNGGTIEARPFRGTTTGNPVDWENQFGNLLGYDLGMGEVASPIVVRFQGARASIGLSDPCDTDPNQLLGGEIEPGTLTRWVAHPAELNGILSQTGTAITPNLIRFVVLFDQTNDPANGDIPGTILAAEGVVGVDNMVINADPN